MDIKTLKKKVKNNDTKAMITLGKHYENNNKINKAMSLYIKASKLKDEEASYMLGNCYFNIKEIKNHIQAFDYYTKSAKEGYYPAYIKIGACYENGFGVRKDNQNALYNYQKATESGEAKAYFVLSEIYFKGDIVEKNSTRAVELLEIAASKNYDLALKKLGLYYFANKNYEKALSYLNLENIKHYPEVLYYLGMCYENGFGVEKDFDRAKEYYQKGKSLANSLCIYRLGEIDLLENNFESAEKNFVINAKNGDTKSIYKLAELYFSGQGVEKNYQKAFNYFIKAYKYGYDKACLDIGICYLNGIGIEANNALAYYYINLAVNKNNLYAYKYLGECYFFGIGVNRDYQKAFEFYNLSIDKGDFTAFLQLGYYYEHYLKDLTKAIETYKIGVDMFNDLDCCIALYRIDKNSNKSYLLKAVEQKLPIALYEFAKIKFDENEIIDYKDYLLKSAKLNCVDAQNELASLYLKGEYVNKDLNEAFNLYRLAALNKNAESLYRLGTFYYYPDGKGINYQIAFQYFKQAASLGHTLAQNLLSDLYYKGKGVPKNVSLAVYWAKKAADSGNAEAQYFLAVCYYYGYGVVKNIETAKAYKELSIKNGFKKSNK